MNRSYQFYLKTQSVKFFKKIAIFLAIILALLTVIYFVGEYFNQNNKKAQEQLSKIELSSSKSASLGASKEAVSRAFKDLSPNRRTNQQIGRQYVIEFLTKEAEVAGLSNFVIESITEKDEIISSNYNELTQIPKIHLLEIVLTFNSVIHRQMYEFFNTVATTSNGVPIWQDVQTKKLIQNIDTETLEAINNGQKIAVLGHRVVVHWFFIR